MGFFTIIPLIVNIAVSHNNVIVKSRIEVKQYNIMMVTPQIYFRDLKQTEALIFIQNTI